MKYSLAAILMLAFASGAVADDVGGQGRVADQLVQLERESWVAWQNHDGRFFDDFLSDDHVEVGFAGPTDKANVVAGVAGGGCTVASYAVDRFKVTMFSTDTALVTYHAAQDTKCGGEAVPSPVWVSSLFVKRDGRWRNALYQHSRAAK